MLLLQNIAHNELGLGLSFLGAKIFSCQLKYNAGINRLIDYFTSSLVNVFVTYLSHGNLQIYDIVSILILVVLLLRLFLHL